MNWWRRWNTLARGLEANTRSVTLQSSLLYVSVNPPQCVTNQATGGVAKLGSQETGGVI